MAYINVKNIGVSNAFYQHFITYAVNCQQKLTSY